MPPRGGFLLPGDGKTGYFLCCCGDNSVARQTPAVLNDVVDGWNEMEPRPGGVQRGRH